MSQTNETPEPALAGIVADASKNNWVDRFAPAKTRPYLRLSRADRAIGTWLLYIPCLWGLVLAANIDGFQLWDLWIALGCGIGAFVMRGAGCTWNDITDRHIDGLVARTRSRPLPSGQATVRQALIWMVAQALIGALILFSFNGLTILLGIASLALVAIYPFAKRFTWWPQAFLGLAFNWGALLAWAAHAGTLHPAAYLLYAAGIIWTLYYDTIYALQDIEDDALIGVKSTARLFGTHVSRWLAGFLVAVIVLLSAAVILAIPASRGPLPMVLGLAGVWGMGLHMLWQMRVLDMSDNESCRRIFISNRDAGFVFVLFLAIAALV
ncbi:4-hydroxybenzoate octaprenyltransferase [Xinfangfangia sp. CPCC 101601]|uniref:4-hydroxybenzoate octaprenyltransferase n=1 Tax=Pseudogemmobacter lacusdianii TaxID=3069608 RepID=A0ABU0W2W7_9RHOB|nr:4-hydroxybenzoate octaprenyltransferase [Xinfangfangia sp. CPCC 101601]MDQ2067425.1 4-hydroxybenzoate octaprenyltransferase [Xinfangfangia sp. CPCC 101601]